MKSIFTKSALKFLSLVFLIVSVVIFIISPVSCRLTEEGIELVGEDTVCPTVTEFYAKSADSFYLSCSEQIVLDEMCIYELSDSDDISDYLFGADVPPFSICSAVTYSEDRKSAKIQFFNSTEVGKTYILSGKVYDITGNSLSFCQKFLGYNENPARLIFNEIRNQTDSATQKTEFVEFYVLKSGNLSGLEFFPASKESSKNYSFPAIDVKKGEYITVHLQTSIVSSGVETQIEGYADELSENLSLSKAAESCDTSRELWVKGNDRFIGTNSDILVLQNAVSKEIQDVVIFSKTCSGEWSKKIQPYAQKAMELGLWTDCETQAGAANSNGMSKNRSLIRTNTKKTSDLYCEEDFVSSVLENSKNNWVVTEKKTGVSTASPGFSND